MNKRMLTMLSLLVGLALLAGLSGCFLPDVFGNVEEEEHPDENYPAALANPQPEPPSSDSQNAAPPAQADPQPETNPQPQADPDPEGPVGPVVEHVWFKEEDCTVPDISGLKASYGPGVLRCRYTWAGQYIDDNKITIEVEEIDDPKELAEALAQGIADFQESADTRSSTDTVNVLQNDKNGFIYMSTGPGGGSAKTNTEIPMCGVGGGYKVVNERFLVLIRILACDHPASSNMEYVKLEESLEAVAQAAITRALAEE